MFKRYFPMIQVAKSSKNAEKDLSNSCPACGFLTLMSRGGYDICPLCFWEDEGLDEKNLTEESAANDCSLEEYRARTEDALQAILHCDAEEGSIAADVKTQLLKIDAIISQFSENRRRELFTEQGKMIALFTHNKIFGIHNLLEKLDD